jgi:hypothetical protein
MIRWATQTIPIQKVAARAAVTIAQTMGLRVVSCLAERTRPLAMAGIFRFLRRALEHDPTGRVSRLQKIARI